MIPHDEMEPREKRWLVEVEYVARGVIEISAPSASRARQKAFVRCASVTLGKAHPPDVEIDYGDLGFTRITGVQECDEHGVPYDPPDCRDMPL